MPDLNVADVSPIGSIVQWEGELSTIPMGWQLCDNTNGTPNLIAKFIRGINTDTTDPGNMGGEDSVALITDELPIHDHGVTDPGHAGHGSTGGVVPSSNGAAVQTPAIYGTSGTSTGNTSGSPTGITISNVGSGNSHENKPSFFELAFIMRLF